MKTLKDISKIRNVTLVNDVRETPRFWGDERAEGKGIEINVEALNPRLRFSFFKFSKASVLFFSLSTFFSSFDCSFLFSFAI